MREPNVAGCVWALVVNALVDGEVVPEEREAVRAHLARCAACAAQFGNALQLDALARQADAEECAVVLAAPTVPLSPGMVERVVDAVMALATVADAAVMLNGAASALASMGLPDTAQGCKTSCDALRQAHAALASQARELADAHTALNGHASTGMSLAKRIAAALGTHAHDIAEMQRRVEEAVREHDAATLNIGRMNAARAEARREADRAIEERDAANARAKAAEERAEKAQGALAKVAERLTMATEFDAGDGAVIKRMGRAWCVKREVQPRGKRWISEFLTPDGSWQRRTVPDFSDVDAALAALAVSRG